VGGNLARAQNNPLISEIQIEGNQRVESDAIRLHITQHTGEALNRDAVSADIKSIYQMGFFQNVTADTRDEGGKEVLVFKVTERPEVTDVKITGMKAIRPSDDKIIAAMKVHPGSIMDPTRVKETEKEIKETYESKGYSDTRVDYQEKLGPNNTEEGTFAVTEGPKTYIQEIDFSGNHAFTARELRAQMDTAHYIPLLSLVTSAGVLDKKKLRDDTDRIASFYYDHGYLNVHVGEPIISRVPKGLKVVIPIDEGPIYKIGSIDVAGDLKYPRSELVPLITIKPGEDFRGSTMQHDVLTLSDFYSDRGFAFVDVQPKTSLDAIARKVNITFNINPGREVLVNRINITGNTRTSDKVIRREMQVQEQEPYSASAIRD
jgi:outer membrane protein insertion porin family